MGSAVHGEAAKREKKLTFYANKSVDGLQLSEYLADFGKWGTILIVTSCLTLSMPYFTSGGHFSDLLRCSKVRQLKVAIVTLRSDQQGDTFNLLPLGPVHRHQFLVPEQNIVNTLSSVLPTKYDGPSTGIFFGLQLSYLIVLPSKITAPTQQ